MKQLKFPTLVLLSMILLFSACEKEEPEQNASLSYSINGSSTVLKADSTLASKNENVIIAYKNGEQSIYLYVSSLSVGTYNFDRTDESKLVLRKSAPKPFNGFYYGEAPDFDVWFQGTVGTITITSVVNNKISGTFDISKGYSDGLTTINSVKGNFTNIEITDRQLVNNL
jgi:hypothetical protein